MTENIKTRFWVVFAAIGTHPVLIYIINNEFGWYEASQVLLVPILTWLFPFLLYLLVLQSRLTTFLGACVILVGYPTNVAIVNLSEDGTAALAFISIPALIIFPALIFVAILDVFVEWVASKWFKPRCPSFWRCWFEGGQLESCEGDKAGS